TPRSELDWHDPSIDLASVTIYQPINDEGESHISLGSTGWQPVLPSTTPRHALRNLPRAESTTLSNDANQI
ncbi:MAG: hypothetical protein DMF04_06105, partial [Verrucomicrobia bacterium]